jgi:xylulokinase
MHSLVAVDGTGATLGGNSALWNDKRCAEQVGDFLARPGSGELSALAANRPLPAWSGFKMAWLRDHMPEAYAKAARLLVAKDFVNFRLCGEMATDPSEASGSFLCDAATGAWSEPLLAALGVGRSKLPDIVASTSVIGGLLDDVAARTGLRGGTPVVAGSGDMMCQLLGSGLTRSGQVTLVAGTASIVATEADEPTADRRAMNLRSANGNWARFGIADAAGVSFRWFADRLCDAAIASFQGQTSDAFDKLTEEAAAVAPGSEGLLFFPYLLGERTLGSDRSRASFVGATLRHHRSHFVRAVMEGITFEDRRSLECLCPDGFVGPVRCTGGGGGSGLWNQIRADVFAHPVETVAGSEGGIVGAAVLAGVGAGWYPDAASGAEAVVKPDRVWYPEGGAVGSYDKAFRTFCAVHDALEPAWEHWDRL